ncbi:MAG TPA: hypothetical protein VGO56_02335 [Pyrinomonadaceae bacterium]|jgi:hypothetical protein|nr:hypothetical protein [Pyrinomonadaceae bacterium]
MPYYQTARRLFAASFIIGLALVCGLSATTQSGRRTKQPPVAVPGPVESPTPTKAVEKPKPELTLIVGMERDNFGYNMANLGVVLEAVVDRLNDNSAIKVEQVRGTLNRGEAVRRAKAEPGGYIVLLEIETESRIVVTTRITEIALQYSVFSPGTAKVKTFGRTYPQGGRSKGVVVSPGKTGVYSDYQLQQAGRQAAEKILDAFHLSGLDRSLGFGSSRRMSRIGVEPINSLPIFLIDHAPLNF